MTRTGVLPEILVSERNQLLDQLPPLRRFPNTPTQMEADFGVPIISYISVEKLIEEFYRFWDAKHSGFCVQNIDTDALERLLDTVEERIPLRIKLYVPETKLLVVKVPFSRAHGDLHFPLYGEIVYTYHRKGGYLPYWSSTGATTYPARAHLRAQLGTSEADAGGCPSDARPGCDCWPTVLVHAGYGHSLEMLRHAMRWSFSASQQEVKVMLLASWENPYGQRGPQDKIIVEKWIETPQPLTRGEATSTAAVRYVPYLDHRTVITYHGPKITESSWHTVSIDDFHVTGGKMVIEYKHLWLREPRTELDKDVIYTEDFWKRYARNMWRSVASSEPGFHVVPLIDA